jgi:predicted nucleic acid-binding protein
MKLLIDINIVLDVILARDPWADEAALLLSGVEEGRAAGYVAGHTITTVHYIAARQRDRRSAATAVTDLLRIVESVPMGDPDFHQALVLGLEDFEDAVQAAAALKIGADFLVTRNRWDFEGVTIPCRTAGELLPLL